ncbi:AGR210Cp [Eremothecium gossypii ATCC 10895]|uniref:AGR210Cp n=1 Tax=Eremothecium gossypii (strain ATCC 10895 / CBS 109.51 / FGSC 9923 / NRRL Y-1056) TaxID=284811 RepID=Q74ZJ2_EREGS|nr:AGR210Cp [Eremothecium gossypii ATCC 10895]AAS54700.1 AGR210Cp [Eremothecium gossypii ATCC 10895]
MSSYNDTGYNSTFFEEKAEPTRTKNVSFYTPLIYVSILIVSLMTFANNYRKKKWEERSRLPSIFSEHAARDLYFEVKELSEREKVHEKVLKAALLNRGAEAVRRTIKLKEFAPHVEVLYKNGSVGDDYWQRYQNEVKLVDYEFKMCIQEAESLQPGWPQLFVTVAKEICFNQALQRRYDAILKRKEEQAARWELKLDENGRLVEPVA